jgi:hypothetical protein
MNDFSINKKINQKKIFRSCYCGNTFEKIVENNDFSTRPKNCDKCKKLWRSGSNIDLFALKKTKE